MRTLVALLSTLVLLGGCLDATTDGDEASDVDGCPASPLDQPGVQIVPTTVDPIVDDKDRALEFETTNVRTCSLPAIGWSALDPDGSPHKYLGELDMRADLGIGAVAVVGSGEPGRVYLVDIGTDPANPTVLSFIDQPGAHVTDVKISDDGKILYTASQATPSGELALATFPDLVAASGFSAYNIEDPAEPAYLGFVEDLGTGCHMLDPVQVAPNQDAVMCTANTLRSYLVQRDLPLLLNLGFVDYSAIPDADPSQVAGLVGGIHDITAFHESGSFGPGSYLVVSHWALGVRLLDISNAPAILEVGAWTGEGATHYRGNVHTAMMFDAGGHRYIVASPELTQQGVVPCLWVLDADDPSALQLQAEWCHPGLHESQGLYLTTHQWQVAPTGPDVAVEDVRLYLTMNHAGMWVLDFGEILHGDAQAAILGFNLARTPIPEDHVGNAILSTWDVNVANGYIYGTDRATGLWVFHYTGDELGDVRLTGFS
jgi:hypothetical protein